MEQKIKYDVALSFAGEDRRYVRSVAYCLKEAGVRVFYDEFQEIDLWGKELTLELEHSYREDSHYNVVFISAAYNTKPWTNHERRIIQERNMLQNGTLLPVAMEEGVRLAAMPGTIFYLKGYELQPEEVAQKIVLKLKHAGDAPSAQQEENNTKGAQEDSSDFLAGWVELPLFQLRKLNAYLHLDGLKAYFKKGRNCQFVLAKTKSHGYWRGYKLGVYSKNWGYIQGAFDLELLVLSYEGKILDAWPREGHEKKDKNTLTDLWSLVSK